MSTRDTTVCFRTCQEALANIARHREATKVIMNLTEEADRIILEMKTGKGIGEDRVTGPRSCGLMGMRERAHMIGARLRMAARPIRGTVVTLALQQG